MSVTYEESVAFVLEETIENLKHLYVAGHFTLEEFEEELDLLLRELDKELKHL